MKEDKEDSSSEDYQLLLKKVESAYGKTITKSADCEVLSLKIQEKTSKIVSSTTLRRLFGLLKSKSKPSKYTIEVLEEFISAEKSN